MIEAHASMIDCTSKWKSNIDCSLSSAANHWAWVPVVACSLGGVLGAMVYTIFIELHHPTTNRTESEPDNPYLPIGHDDMEEDEISAAV